MKLLHDILLIQPVAEGYLADDAGGDEKRTNKGVLLMKSNNISDETLSLGEIVYFKDVDGVHFDKKGDNRVLINACDIICSSKENTNIFVYEDMEFYGEQAIDLGKVIL
jgi:hypothetical protein